MVEGEHLVSAEGYVGLSESHALTLARSSGVREIRVVAPGQPILLDARPGRLTLVVEDGTVTSANFG